MHLCVKYSDVRESHIFQQYSLYDKNWILNKSFIRDKLLYCNKENNHDQVFRECKKRDSHNSAILAWFESRRPEFTSQPRSRFTCLYFYNIRFNWRKAYDFSFSCGTRTSNTVKFKKISVFTYLDMFLIIYTTVRVIQTFHVFRHFIKNSLLTDHVLDIKVI